MASAKPSAPAKPWHSYITIDLIAVVLSRTFFHPFIACLIPLCLRAISLPYHSPQVIATCIFAAVVTSSWILAEVNRRVAYGRAREIDWDEEVVVITGGASGLGSILAQTYGMRGASVAILDVKEPEAGSEGMEDVRFYRCDVGDIASVEKAKQDIVKDLGRVTILINNAGVLSARRLWDLSTAQVQRSFNVNLLSHFHTIRTFLPDMFSAPAGGTIVTVSSVLGKLGANYLSDYTAAKAGLIAMHTSLRADLATPNAPAGAENIRLILVTPGQLSTSLFAGVETPSNFIGPVVEPVDLAKEIVRMIDAGEAGEISLPLYTQWIEWLNVLPMALQGLARWLSGMDAAMVKSHGKKSQ